MISQMVGALMGAVAAGHTSRPGRLLYFSMLVALCSDPWLFDSKKGE